MQSDTAMRNKNRLFGDLELAWGDSRMEDMLNDDSPYCDYSNMEDELYGYLERMIGQEVPPPSPSENGRFGVYHRGQNRYHDST